MALIVLLLSGMALSGSTFGPEVAAEPPQVEFVHVEGGTCLQAIVTMSRPELADFRAAELRWLAKNYPGSTASRWETVLVLVLGPRDEDEPESVTVQRETAHAETLDGSTVSACFDVNLTELKKVPGE
jgi:hypothetical protein